MKKIVLRFGLISGGILAAMAAVMVPLSASGAIDFGTGEIVGYSTMLVSFLLVFFGIRTYREDVGGGAITFGKAFQVGIIITLISCAMYVFTWEIIYFNFVPDFVDKYGEFTIDKLRTEGATDAAIEAATTKVAEFKELFKNPLINSAMTFLQVFPIGLIVTLVSAAILRRRPVSGAATTATAIA